MSHTPNLLVDDTPKRAINSSPKNTMDMVGLAEVSFNPVSHSWHWPPSPSPGHLMPWLSVQGSALHFAYHVNLLTPTKD